MIFLRYACNISLYLQFFNFCIFFTYQLCGNLKVSLFSERTFPYFEEILVTAWSLQNYGDLFVAGLKVSYMPLKAENCMQNVKKVKSFIVAFLFH